MKAAALPRARSRRRHAFAPLLCALLSLGGCAGPSGPAAWDKSFVAKPEMSMSWNALATRLEQQVYESKEAASGGYGVGGGGCGCN
ncbi:MAG: DUF4266 domain-containing protein [Burkholderiales bacterium]|nr:DUF4266 domain-containing protein [Burkholderiales bacterium]